MKLLRRFAIPLVGACLIAATGCSDASAPPLPQPGDDEEPRDSTPQTSYILPGTDPLT